jgi:hypothetical protein
MKTLAKLRFPSSQRLSERLDQHPKRERVVVVRDSDSAMEDHFIFRGVAALLITYHDACPIEANAAYDSLVEVPNSKWAAEISQRMKRNTQISHYRLYLDDGPCYDLLAESYEYRNENGA